MKLASKKDAPANATLSQKLACWIIKARLVSMYSHAGIVIDGDLYHMTSTKGWEVVKAGDWSPEKWDLTDFNGDKEKVKELFRKKSLPPTGTVKSLVWKLCKGYDWFGLLAFVGPKVRVSWLDYCFEWCYLAITGNAPKGRVTVEILLVECQKTQKGFL